MRTAAREREGKREETVHVCLWETDVVVNASLSEPTLPSIKNYRHIKAIAESTQRQFQMLPSSNDVERNYFPALCLRSSSRTDSSQVSLRLFLCKWDKLKRKPPLTCSTHAHTQTPLVFTESDHAEMLSNSLQNAAKVEDF